MTNDIGVEILDSTEETGMFIKPDFILRIKSMFIDTVVILVLLFIAYAFISNIGIESSLINAIAFIFIVLYEPIFTSIDRTIGQRLMNLRVVRKTEYVEDNNKANITFFQSILRYITKLVLGFISLFTVHSDRFGRAMHDHMSNTVMIND